MKVVIMGLGLYKEGSGISAAKFFIGRGDRVLITDLKKRAELAAQIKEIEKFCQKKRQKMPRLILGRHRDEDFMEADLVLRNPGVRRDSPYLRLAKKGGAKIETDISIFLKNTRAQVIGVTGTRGKSTAATLIYELLKTKYKKVWLGGNIKISPLSFLGEVRDKDLIVLELSSWQLENFKEEKIAPQVAVITNIYPDHLNTYKNMAEYIRAKKNIFFHQRKNDYLIINGENQETKKWRGPGKTIYFAKKNLAGFKNMRLRGEHNLENIAAAFAAAKIFKVPMAAIKKVLREFKGLPARQELAAEINGIKYINDTTATTPDGTIAALRVFGGAGRIILIAGGSDKNLEYGALAKEIKKYCKKIILLPGTATEKIRNELRIMHNELRIVKNMEGAVGEASSLAKRGDIILLSPGAASFGLFQNEFDRGEQFTKAVRALLRRAKT